VTQAAIHDTADYFDHPYFQQRRSAQARIDQRCRKIFQHIGRGIDLAQVRGDRLLDVGCDTGAFLVAAARQFGLQPWGVDVSARAVAIAQQQGIAAYHTDLEQAPDELQNFPVITAIDVIEHVVDPRRLLQAIFSRLRPGGVAYLETPNIESSVYRVGRSLTNFTGGYPTGLCERLFPAQHIQYFTHRSFRTLVLECGFEVVQFQNRILPFQDIATSWVVQVGLAPLQFFDKLTGNEILICALLRKPT
jgi:cyclopropane fatty-acyl-phospholipid synthase-like methyltransferase